MTNNGTTAARVVVGVDGSPSSIEALRHARRMATALDAQMDAVAAWQVLPYLGAPVAADLRQEAEAKTWLNESITAAFGDDAPAGLRTIVRQGVATKALVEASRDAEMMLGSVSSQCAEHAHCPVLVVHSGDHR